MAMDLFSNPTLNAMEAYMTRLTRRLEVVNSNISNLETPGYRTKEVSFHATMQELLNDYDNFQTARRENDSRWVPAVPVFEVQALSAGDNSNNVSIDKEMKKLGDTKFGYALITQFLQSKFRIIGLSINEGNRS